MRRAQDNYDRYIRGHSRLKEDIYTNMDAPHRRAMEQKKPDTEEYGALCMKVKHGQIGSAMSEVMRVAPGADMWALMEHPLYSAS